MPVCVLRGSREGGNLLVHSLSFFLSPTSLCLLSPSPSLSVYWKLNQVLHTLDGHSVTLFSPTCPGYFRIRSPTPLVPDLVKPQELEGAQEEPLCYGRLLSPWRQWVFVLFCVLPFLEVFRDPSFTLALSHSEGGQMLARETLALQEVLRNSGHSPRRQLRQSICHQGLSAWFK